MNLPAPVSFAQALRLMAWLALRRQINRWQSVQLARRKKDPAKRTGTGNKSSGRSVYSVFLMAILVFNGFNLASQGLSRLSALARNAHARTDKIQVSAYTRSRLVEINRELTRIQRDNDPIERAKYEGPWNHYLDAILRDEVSRQSLSDDEEATRLQQMHDTFNRDGPSAFAALSPEELYSGSHTWPRAAGPSLIFQNTLGLLLLLFVPVLVCLWLGMNNKDLGQVEWSFEWLYSFPISARALLASRLFVYSLFNPPVWFFICPLLIVINYSGGAGFNAIPLGIAGTLYLSILAGSATMLLEVVLRKFVSLGPLKNLQALFTVVGTTGLLLYLASLFSRPLEGFLIDKARWLPATFTWNPLTGLLLLGTPGQSSPVFTATAIALVVFALMTAAIALFSGEFLIRDGLLRAGGPYQGVRRKAVGGASSGGWFRGVAANEMILLRRDRNLLVQVLVSPLIVIAYYFLVNSSMVTSATGNFHHAATIAFVIGAYVLMSSAMPVLTRENKTLWQLLTFPRSIDSILFEKTKVWAIFALIYSGTTLLILAHFNRHLNASAWLDAFLALYGVGLYAFIAAGIGIMGTNPLETEVRARFRTDMVYLYMILVAMYAVTIYMPSIWSKFAELVLSSLLAYALWQKVKDVSPYLLDPTEKPARTLSLADGMMAALAFFVMQALFALFLFRTSVPFGMQILVAYVLAGFVVCALCLAVFSSQKIGRLWESVGLSRAEKDRVPLRGVILIGLAYGGAAALGAALYLHVVDLVPAWRVWKEDSEINSLLARPENFVWTFLLAVAAAPLFEEFIFRGLVFQGLRRGLGPFRAVLASAALFALVHPPFSVIPVFGLGVAAALSFQRSKFLLAPIITHATYNACVLFLNR
jgi:ABC-2 type transport system permease protein